MSNEEKRQALKAKIEAAEARNEARSLGEYAQQTADSAVKLVKEHPIKTVAGIAVVGLVIGAMTGPGRRAGAAAGKRVNILASTAAELGMAYASGILDTAGGLAASGRERLEDAGDAISDNASELKRRTAFFGGNAAASAKAIPRETSKKAGRSIRGLKARISN